MPLKFVSTVPADVTLVTTTPMPAPSPAASAWPSAWPSENDWLRTVTAPPAVICVPEPTVVSSTRRVRDRDEAARDAGAERDRAERHARERRRDRDRLAVADTVL